MLGVEAFGVFALGQAEPWTLKGKQKFKRNRGKVKYDYGDVQGGAQPEPRPMRPKKFPPVSPEVRALIMAQEERLRALRRDDEEAITLLLMTH